MPTWANCRLFFQTVAVCARRLTTERINTFTSFCLLTGFGSPQLTSTLTITKCLLSSAISWDLANTGFNATRENIKWLSLIVFLQSLFAALMNYNLWFKEAFVDSLYLDYLLLRVSDRNTWKHLALTLISKGLCTKRDELKNVCCKWLTLKVAHSSIWNWTFVCSLSKYCLTSTFSFPLQEFNIG